MNFGLNISCKVENVLQDLVANITGYEKGEGAWLDNAEEEQLYQRALEHVIQSSDNQEWLASGNIRLGEIILIVDSDTQVVSTV
jgi:hypothetical protein